MNDGTMRKLEIMLNIVLSIIQIVTSMQFNNIISSKYVIYQNNKQVHASVFYVWVLYPIGGRALSFLGVGGGIFYVVGWMTGAGLFSFIYFMIFEPSVIVSVYIFPLLFSFY